MDHFTAKNCYSLNTRQPRALCWGEVWKQGVASPKYILPSPFFQARDSSVKKKAGVGQTDVEVKYTADATKGSPDRKPNSLWPAR